MALRLVPGRPPAPIRTLDPEATPATPRAPHVVAWVTGEPEDLTVIARGRALADAVQGRLTILYAFSPGGRAPAVGLANLRSQARASGAPFIEVPAYTAIDGLVEFTMQRGTTQIVLSCPPHVLRRGSLVEELVERLDGVDLYVLPRSPLRVPAT